MAALARTERSECASVSVTKAADRRGGQRKNNSRRAWLKFHFPRWLWKKIFFSLPPRMKLFLRFSVALFAASAFAADQPQFGQAWTRNMVSAERGLPDAFDPKTGKNIKWTAGIGMTPGTATSFLT